MKKKILIRSNFAGALVVIAGLFTASLIKTNIYSSKKYEQSLTGSDLFTSTPDKSQRASLNIIPRDGKIEMDY